MQIVSKTKENCPENNILFLIKLYDEEKKSKHNLDFDEWLDIILFTQSVQKSK